MQRRYLAAMFFIVVSAHGDSLVRHPELEEAQRVVGPKTNERKGALIFVTAATDGTLLAVTNYVPSGEHDSRTVVEPNAPTLDWIVSELLWLRDGDVDAAERAITDDVRFIVAFGALRQAGIWHLNFNAATNVQDYPFAPHQASQAQPIAAVTESKGPIIAAKPPTSTLPSPVAKPTEPPPKSIPEALIAMLWGNVPGRITVFVVAGVVGVVALWHTFPDDIKSGLLRRLFRAKRKRRNRAA